MNLTEFYSHLLDLEEPWQINKVDINEADKSIHIYVGHPKHSHFNCETCDVSCSVYDHKPERQWRHLDTCDYQTYIHCALPRIACGCHSKRSVKTVIPPWSRKGSRFTLAFERHALAWLQASENIRSSAVGLKISEDQLRYMRDAAVKRGMARRAKDKSLKVVHLCIDEKSLFRGHHYVTIFYDGETGAVLEVAEHRTKEATELAFKELKKVIDVADIDVVSMDMWEAFRSATKIELPDVPIVHDRFHIEGYLNKAVDIVRRAENKRLRKSADERLKGTKYIWLKRPENLKPKQEALHQDLIKDTDLQTVKAWELKESFKQFFEAEDKESATTFYDTWWEKVERTGLKPLIKVGKMIKNHWKRMLNYFDNKVSNAMAECKNAKIQRIKMKACGFKSAKAFRTSILFYCGELDLYP